MNHIVCPEINTGLGIKIILFAINNQALQNSKIEFNPIKFLII